MSEVLDHDAEHWLEVVEWPQGKRVLFAGRVLRRRVGVSYPPGWYVIRTCPCHDGEPVSLTQPDRESAENARRGMLRTSRVALALGWVDSGVGR